MSDGVEVEILGTKSELTVAETSTTIDVSENTTDVVANDTQIELNIAPQVTTLTTSDQITELNVNPVVTSVEVRGVSLATSNATAINTDHDTNSWLYLDPNTTTVQGSLDRLAESTLDSPPIT